jgi:hypothetical protein
MPDIRWNPHHESVSKVRDEASRPKRALGSKGPIDVSSSITWSTRQRTDAVQRNVASFYDALVLRWKLASLTPFGPSASFGNVNGAHDEPEWLR